MRNLNSSSWIFDDDLDYSFNFLFSIFPSFLVELGSLNFEDWEWAKLLDPFYIADYMKANSGVLGTLFKYKIDSESEKKIGYAIADNVYNINKTFQTTVDKMKSEGTLSKYLSEGFSFTNKQTAKVLEYNQHFKKCIKCFYNEFMLKAFKIVINYDDECMNEF